MAAVSARRAIKVDQHGIHGDYDTIYMPMPELNCNEYGDILCSVQFIGAYSSRMHCDYTHCTLQGSAIVRSCVASAANPRWHAEWVTEIW